MIADCLFGLRTFFRVSYYFHVYTGLKWYMLVHLLECVTMQSPAEMSYCETYNPCSDLCFRLFCRIVWDKLPVMIISSLVVSADWRGFYGSFQYQYVGIA